jgi:long-chain-fatty-acid--CoA ligase ACSBG
MPSTGIGSEIRPDTLSNVMRKTAKERGDAPALKI